MAVDLEQYRTGMKDVPIPEDNAPYLNAGYYYRAIVNNVLLRESRKDAGVVFQVAELTIIESNDPAFPPSSDASWLVKMGNKSTQGNRAGFFLAVGQETYDGFTSKGLGDQFIYDHCVIEGTQAEPFQDGDVILGVKTVGQPLREKDGIFTKHFWCPDPDGDDKNEDFLNKLRAPAPAAE